MTTFSQLVDSLATEAVRPDLKASIVSYINQTIRELHFKPGTQSPALYGANRFEEEVVVGVSGTYLWDIPAPARFQRLEAVYVVDLDRYIYPKSPTEIYKDGVATDIPFKDMYWYRTGPQVAINTMSAGWTLRLSWFEYPRRFVYYAVGSRPSVYDPETETYTGDSAAQEKCTHWILQRWEDAVLEGGRAKLYKRLGDESRGRMSYSAFESHRNQVWDAEGMP